MTAVELVEGESIGFSKEVRNQVVLRVFDKLRLPVVIIDVPIVPHGNEGYMVGQSKRSGALLSDGGSHVRI